MEGFECPDRLLARIREALSVDYDTYAASCSPCYCDVSRAIWTSMLLNMERWAQCEAAPTHSR